MLTCVGQHEQILQGKHFMTSYLLSSGPIVNSFHFVQIASFTYVLTSNIRHHRNHQVQLQYNITEHIPPPPPPPPQSTPASIRINNRNLDQGILLF